MTKDEQDALIFLSQTHRGLHEQRSKQDFKIVIGTLSFFAGCVAVRFSTTTMLPTNGFFPWVVWIAFIILAVVAMSNFWMTRRSSKINQNIAQKAEDAIIEDLPEKTLLKSCRVNDNPRKHVWFWQAIIVFLGAIVSATLITGTALFALSVLILTLFLAWKFRRKIFLCDMPKQQPETLPLE